jgi:itaconyl-CoA hydratase
MTSTAERGSTTPTIGWQGRYFEDFAVGDRYRHPLGRTVIQTDNSWFTLLTQNTSPVHFDVHYAAQTEFGKPLVDSTFTLALVTGQSVVDLTQHVFANLGWDRVRCPNPLFEGDTVYSQSEVLSVRESQSRPDVGIVTVRTVGYTRKARSSSPLNAPSWCIGAVMGRGSPTLSRSGTLARCPRLGWPTVPRASDDGLRATSVVAVCSGRSARAIRQSGGRRRRRGDL